jgi:hypothetical protein
LQDHRPAVVAKAKSIEDFVFTMGGIVDITAAMQLLVEERPLMRGVLGGTPHGRGDATREDSFENICDFLRKVSAAHGVKSKARGTKTLGSRRKEDNNVTQAILAAMCSAEIVSKQQVRSMARITGMSRALIKKCCFKKQVFDEYD